jgi:hypothetical protein
VAGIGEQREAAGQEARRDLDGQKGGRHREDEAETPAAAVRVRVGHPLRG